MKVLIVLVLSALTCACSAIATERDGEAKRIADEQSVAEGMALLPRVDATVEIVTGWLATDGDTEIMRGVTRAIAVGRFAVICGLLKIQLESALKNPSEDANAYLHSAWVTPLARVGMTMTEFAQACGDVYVPAYCDIVTVAYDLPKCGASSFLN